MQSKTMCSLKWYGYSLQVGEHLLDALLVGRVNHRSFAQVTLNFGFFVGEHVASVRVGTLQFAGTSSFETLRRAAVSFHLSHDCETSKSSVEISCWCFSATG
jgi:hypothetical protein